MKKGFLLIGLGFEAGVLLWLFVYIGQKMDRRLNTKGWITASLTILVLFLWFYQLIRLFKPPRG